MLVEWSAPCQIKITTNSCPSLPPLLTSKQTFQKFFIFITLGYRWLKLWMRKILKIQPSLPSNEQESWYCQRSDVSIPHFTWHDCNKQKRSIFYSPLKIRLRPIQRWHMINTILQPFNGATCTFFFSFMEYDFDRSSSSTL